MLFAFVTMFFSIFVFEDLRLITPLTAKSYSVRARTLCMCMYVYSVLQYYKYYVFVKITLLSGYQVRYGLQKKKYMCVTVYIQNKIDS